jgi:hypothetical protein
MSMSFPLSLHRTLRITSLPYVRFLNSDLEKNSLIAVLDTVLHSPTGHLQILVRVRAAK